MKSTSSGIDAITASDLIHAKNSTAVQRFLWKRMGYTQSVLMNSNIPVLLSTLIQAESQVFQKPETKDPKLFFNVL